MSELLLEKKLRESKPEDEVRKIARVRTLTVLPRLDAKRKGRVLQFIYEAGLIDKGRPIIDLKGANLREADLHQADMYKVDLFRANLIGANLSGANLCQAHMDQADLSSADLSETILMSALLFQTNFSRACLSRVLLAGAFMIETNLEGTTITLEELDGVDSLMGAIMPDGSIHS
jgi:uncharacterized protein YjbI with pentapeptide repeats